LEHIASISGSTNLISPPLIRQGLSPLNPSGQQIRAARVALDMARDLISQKQSFSLETTLSGKTHLRLVAQAKTQGMAVKLLYFYMDTPEQCLERVARRVSEGGHGVPEVDLRRRFSRSLNNFAAYAHECDFWRIYDANGRQPVTLAEGGFGKVTHDSGARAPLQIAKALERS
jgi:predicted ABC-type ATPase